MEELRLTVPSAEHEEAFLQMMDEWENTGEEITPGVLRRRGSYVEWLAGVDARRRRETCPPPLVPADTYFLTGAKGRLIGAVNLRHELNEMLLEIGGHIGYGIRPAERGKRYAPVMLRLALEKCRELGIMKVLVTCDKSNPASAHTILANGGVLENEFCEPDGNIVQRYWIELA